MQTNKNNFKLDKNVISELLKEIEIKTLQIIKQKKLNILN
jgi:hypothetical protein